MSARAIIRVNLDSVSRHRGESRAPSSQDKRMRIVPCGRVTIIREFNLDLLMYRKDKFLRCDLPSAWSPRLAAKSTSQSDKASGNPSEGVSRLGPVHLISALHFLFLDLIWRGTDCGLPDIPQYLSGFHAVIFKRYRVWYDVMSTS